jgi:hypothetical protein
LQRIERAADEVEITPVVDAVTDQPKPLNQPKHARRNAQIRLRRAELQEDTDGVVDADTRSSSSLKLPGVAFESCAGGAEGEGELGRLRQ